MREKLRHLRKMADEHDVPPLAALARGTSFCRDGIDDPGRWVGGLKAASGGERRERIAAPPEGFGGLLRAELAAVPDDSRLHTPFRRFLREQIDFDAAARGERPRRIDIWSYGIAVMNKIQLQKVYLETIFSSVAAMAILSFSPVTSPVSVTVWDMCATSLAFMSAASVPVTL